MWNQIFTKRNLIFLGIPGNPIKSFLSRICLVSSRMVFCYRLVVGLYSISWQTGTYSSKWYFKMWKIPINSGDYPERNENARFFMTLVETLIKKQKALSHSNFSVLQHAVFRFGIRHFVTRTPSSPSFFVWTDVMKYLVFGKAFVNEINDISQPIMVFVVFFYSNSSPCHSDIGRSAE